MSRDRGGEGERVNPDQLLVLKYNIQTIEFSEELYRLHQYCNCTMNMNRPVFLQVGTRGEKRGNQGILGCLDQNHWDD